MPTEEEYRTQTLDRHIDEKFAEIFFLTKEEFHVPSNSECEKELYSMLDVFKRKIKLYCETRQKPAATEEFEI
jgi:hypothetical protein